MNETITDLRVGSDPGAHLELNIAIKDAIPHLISSLAAINTSSQGLNLITQIFAELSEQGDFHDEISPVIQGLFISLLDRLQYNVTAPAVARMAKRVDLRSDFRAAIPPFLTSLKNMNTDPGSAFDFIMSELYTDVEYREAIEAATPMFISLLTARSVPTQYASLSVIFKLSENRSTSDSIQATVPVLLGLLGDRNEDLQSAATTVITKLLEKSSVHNAFRDAIPAFINVVGTSSRQPAHDMLITLADNADFRSVMGGVVMKLANPDLNGPRGLAHQTISKLATHAEFSPEIVSAIPELFRLSRSSNLGVQEVIKIIVELAAFEEFREALHASMPVIDQGTRVSENYIRMFTNLPGDFDLSSVFTAPVQTFIVLLNDTRSEVRLATASMMARMVEHVELRDSVRYTTPTLIIMLDDTNRGVQAAAVSTLAAFAAYAEFRTVIRSGFSRMVDMLDRDDPDGVVTATTSTLGQLSLYAEFLDLIRATVSKFTAKVGQRNQYQYISVLAKWISQPGLHDTISAGMAELIRKITHGEDGISQVTVYKLSEMAKYTQLRNLVQAAIPDAVPLLRNQDSSIRGSAFRVLTDLVAYADLHDTLQPAFVSLLDLLKEPQWELQDSVMGILPDLGTHEKFRDSVVASVPSLAELLANNNKNRWGSVIASFLSLEKLLANNDVNLRLAAVETLRKLAPTTALRNAVRALVPGLVDKLRDIWEVRFAAFKALTDMGTYDEYREALGGLNPPLTELVGQDKPLQDDVIPYLRRWIPYGVPNALQETIPSLFGLSLANDLVTLGLSCDTLVLFAADASLNNAIREFVPSFISQLPSADETTRQFAVAGLAKVGRYVNIQDAIGPLIPPLIQQFKGKRPRVDQFLLFLYYQRDVLAAVQFYRGFGN
ncbi:hypothetical protein M408DRAFT_28086 [Serendipita vermifera MAFF 305830]|uniref:TOG domain-containing protein n=1 Tax=Serendipita vermifera MAFF 305830 TaxID=933852 RepID=A0A0C3AEW3_SERVB|nr:hypothetical protein M408DRAFT_28086 [Serendipita vermifera MAFF 305830]